MEGLGTVGGALVFTAVNTVESLLGVILAGLQSPVGRVSEAPFWGLEHTSPSCRAYLLSHSSGGGFLMFCQCGACMSGCPERPFRLLLCRPEDRQPQVPHQAVSRKGHKNFSVLGFPNDMEFL